MKAQHTPTPWKLGHWSQQLVENEFGNTCVAVCPKDRANYRLGIPRTEAEANAALIVRAVNAHAALVEALEHWINQTYIDEDGGCCPASLFDPEGYTKAEAALKLAPMWRELIHALSAEARAELLRGVLRTRKRGIPFRLNGRYQIVKRAAVRDYLRAMK